MHNARKSGNSASNIFYLWYDGWLNKTWKNGNSTVTFRRFPRTRDLYLRGVRAPCSTASWRCWRLFYASRCVYLPLEPAGCPHTSKWRRWRGCNFLSSLITVKFCHSRKSKMLDPSGCFYFTIPRITVRVSLGPEQKIAGLVANTIANKLYFASTRKVHAIKRYTG